MRDTGLLRIFTSCIVYIGQTFFCEWKFYLSLDFLITVSSQLQVTASDMSQPALQIDKLNSREVHPVQRKCLRRVIVPA